MLGHNIGFNTKSQYINHQIFQRPLVLNLILCPSSSEDATGDFKVFLIFLHHGYGFCTDGCRT